MKSFLLGQVVLDTRNSRSALSPSNLPAAIAINDRAVSCDHQRLVKRELPSFGKCRQSRRRNREPMSRVSGVRAEFFDTTGHKPALKPVRLRCVVARLASVRYHGKFRGYSAVPASNSSTAQKSERAWSEVQTLSTNTILNFVLKRRRGEPAGHRNPYCGGFCGASKCRVLPAKDLWCHLPAREGIALAVEDRNAPTAAFGRTFEPPSLAAVIARCAEKLNPAFLALGGALIR